MNMNYEKEEKALVKYGKNLTKLAEENKLDPVIGRDDEIRRMIRILSRKTKNNPVLVGEPGVGKTAIIEGFAHKIIEGQVPENLKKAQVIEIDLASLIAGASYQGEFEKRLKQLLKEVEESKDELILFIDEIHMLIGTGKAGSNSGMDAANIIKPLMARGVLHLVGATTFDEYRIYIESDPALERRMQKIDVSEPSVESTITILRGIKERLEHFHKVKITDESLVAAAKLSNRYITDRFLPDKAIDLVDEAAATIKTEMNFQPEVLEKLKQEKITLEMEKIALRDSKNSKERVEEITKLLEVNKANITKLENQWNLEKEKLNKLANLQKKLIDLKFAFNTAQNDGNFELASKIKYSDIPNLEKQISDLEMSKNSANTLLKDTVKEEDIAKIVSKWTKIPVQKLVETEKNKLLNLEKELDKEIIGQKEAVNLVSQSILRTKININDPNKPLASFLFLGPTGVGKTELARKLALNLFDSEKQMIRLDMSEYMEKHSVAKIIGAPPGYVGYDGGGHLTERIRKNPYTILLLDEIEKAHHDVLNVFLQLLDNGFITDAKGKNINCRNLIVIMTSNLGALEILKNKKPLPEKDIKNILIKFLKPEFINRIDEIISFNPLKKEDVEEIAKIELEKLAKRIKEAKEIELVFSKKVTEKIVNEAYDPEYGARPIRRYIQKNIENIIALKIIEDNLQNVKLELNVENDKFKLT
ncbi:ATP-dependent Clp protease ATP-binding subunit [Mycoplasmopsis glycophila]|uniref:ATPase n=1 Tax=Mycoplasmopsis glycophila TaxID=171285 RepID=A0A449AV36_9BACT|nr:AAA family ATPase [Mycoplasmopsis glycophila]VEU70379.1 ATPase [Mycoplasmopsis glycophila]